MEDLIKIGTSVEDIQTGLTYEVVGFACYKYDPTQYWVQRIKDNEVKTEWLSASRVKSIQ